MIITNSKFLKNYKLLLKDGKKFGIKIHYRTQDIPRGIPEAFKIGQKFVKRILLYYFLVTTYFIHGLVDLIEHSINNNTGCSIFTYAVNNPEDFGVLKITKNKISK